MMSEIPLHRSGAGFFPRRLRLVVTLSLAFALSAGNLAAAPFTPTADGVVLERLPDAGDAAARTLRRLQATLANDPKNLDLATRVAHADLERARALADPRYLGRAEAAMAPWPEPGAPPEIELLRATVLQSNHEFDTATALLGDVLAHDPRSRQAWLTRAAIEQAQANYPAAIADCGQFAALTLGLAPDTCTAATMSLRGHAPLALKALDISLQQNATEPVEVRIWAMTLAAEIADRLDDASTESRFRAVLALAPTDPYLLGAWSDFLLDHNRNDEVIATLKNFTRVDPLLLRLAIAEQAEHRAEAADHIADLGTRFEASKLRGETVHRREEARFHLTLLHDTAGALTLARANWGVQREPADARVLLETALAAADPDAAAPALDWLRANHVQDVRLAELATRLAATHPARS